MTAIHTRHLAATDRLGERIRASAGRHTITLPWMYEAHDWRDVHAEAARQLCIKAGWTDYSLRGDTIDGGGMVWVQLSPDTWQVHEGFLK